MSEIKWTQSQLDAIECRGANMLVSASAGSGKTAVLTRRLIGMLTDRENPCDISRMLIVTFTKKAASELKEKIASALEDAIEKNPSDTHILRQRMLLGSAKISTIDSFCYDIVRNNFALLSLPAGMRIADESEITLLAKSVMDETIEYMYESDESFFAFASMLTSEREEKSVGDIFIDVYNKLSVYQPGIEFVREYAESLLEVNRKNFSTGKWGRMLAEALSPALEHYRAVFTAGNDYLKSDEKLMKSYLPAFENDLNFITGALEAAAKRDYARLKKIFHDYTPVSLGGARNASEYTIALREARNSFKKLWEKFRGEYFAYDFDQVIEQFSSNSEMCMVLYRSLAEFEKRFSAEKLRRKSLSFADVTRYTNRLLFDDDGRKTAAAKSIAAAFDYIFVDEYQDTNRLQDRIFEGIRGKDNFFIVGDVKQSIYAFRGSQPMLFESYRTREGFKNISLSENFRSDRNIIDFANRVTELIFGGGRSEFSYSESDLLIHAAPDDRENMVEIVVSKGGKAANDEADFIVSEVKKAVLAGIPPEKIAVLFRSGGKKTAQIEKALKKADIAHAAAVRDDFFSQPDVLFLLCLLNVIDNPKRDIYLAGALKSPLFGFTPDDLARLRYTPADTPQASKKNSLYDLLKEDKSIKSTAFLSFLEKYRFLAQSCPVGRLLFMLYQTEGLDAFCSKNNMLTLYRAALQFENGEYKGLYSFINYLNDMISSGKGLSADAENTRPGEISFMTIHRSKGLEFDVVILADTDKKYNRRDEAKPLLFSSEGIGVYLPDRTGFARNDTLLRNLIASRIEKVAAEEEKRVLYTAITRAKKSLYVTASASKPEELIEKHRRESIFLSDYSVNSAKNQLSTILTSFFTGQSDKFCELIPGGQTMVPPEEKGREEGETENREIEYQSEKTVLETRFAYEYPYVYASQVPAKASISLLYTDMLDEDAAQEEYEEDYSFDDLPVFLSGKDEKSGAKRGNATHLFMQFCEFENVKTKGIEWEVNRLVREAFIGKQDAERINTGEVKGFFESALFAEMSGSKYLIREKRFNVNLPAEMFTMDEALKEKLKNETVLAQGVIDCLFEDERGELVLVDYKTDYIPLADRDIGEEILIKRHERQLKYYERAIEIIFRRKVSRTYIYSFSLGKAISVEI